MKVIEKKKSNKDSVDLDRFRQKRKKWWLLVPFLVVVGIVLWYGSTIFMAIQRATVPNQTNGSNTVLKNAKDDNSEPINVLLIGIGGETHPGGTLADSIMVASIDTKTKTISLLSLPRDLYVSIPGIGKDKINAAHSHGENRQKNSGPVLLKQTVSNTLGIPIHYFIRVDFDGFKKIIDTLGGVNVNVAKAIHDPLFPASDMKGYDPFSISAGPHVLDGKTALKYVRSRETTSDFDRARRQQEVMAAIKDKLISAQTLANPKKVTDIISVLGRHILTDFSAGEIDQLLGIGKDLGSPTVRRQVIENGEDGLVMSGRSPIGASIQIPKAGINDFSEIQFFTRAYFAYPRVEKEKTTARLERGTATKEQVSRIKQHLEWAGMIVTVAEAQNTVELKSVIYQNVSTKPVSVHYLNATYKLKPEVSTKRVTTETAPAEDFTFVVGADIVGILKTASPAPSSSPVSGHDSLRDTSFVPTSSPTLFSSNAQGGATNSSHKAN